MSRTIEELLGLSPAAWDPAGRSTTMRFSFLFFSDVRHDVQDREKYAFMRDITLFADETGFEAIYLPERHFHEFGSIYANPAIMAAHLIPQTRRIRFRTAGVSLPLHHPAEVVEWWAMNDILSGGRVDLGFGSGWAREDFVLAPENYEERRRICGERIGIVQKLWRGETVSFAGPGGQTFAISVHPRPLQPELRVWALVTQSDEGFAHAGRQGHNVFTMLYGNNLDVMQRKIALYRAGRVAAGLDPAAGTVTLMLHTLVLENRALVAAAVEEPFRRYIKSSLDVHMQAAARDTGRAIPDEATKASILDYAYERYFRTGALFGSIDDAMRMVEQTKAAGVDEIACLVDFGVDYGIVKDSLGPLARLAAAWR